MELVKQGPKAGLRKLLRKIEDDNLFLLSSSISYYSAVAIAPFLLILLTVASLLGQEVQGKIIVLASDFSLEVGQLVSIIFNNVNASANIRSLTGILGIFGLFLTSSFFFLQLRFSFDVIFGLHDLKGRRTMLGTLHELIFAMLVVLVAGLFLILSTSLPGLLTFFGKSRTLFLIGAFCLNFLTYVLFFWGLIFFCPSKSPGKRESLKMAFLSSVFFILGNFLLGYYFRSVATSSVYGAAGTLLAFLIWSYYSSFTLFLSVEILNHLKKFRRI